MRTRDKIIMTAHESLLLAQIRLTKISPIAGAMFAMCEREESLLRDSIWCDGTKILFNPGYVRSAAPEELVAQLCWCMVRLTMQSEASATIIIEQFDEKGLFRRDRKLPLFAHGSDSCVNHKEWSQTVWRVASYFRTHNFLKDTSPLGAFFEWLPIAESSIQTRLIQTALAMPLRARISESAEEQFWVLAGLVNRFTQKSPNKIFKAFSLYAMRLNDAMCAIGFQFGVMTNCHIVVAGEAKDGKISYGSFIEPINERFKNIIRADKHTR